MQTVYWPGVETLDVTCSVTTIGVFDGVHLGHQRILSQLVESAGATRCAATVVTFDRHPGRVVRDASKPALTSLAHRLHLFEALGVDLCVVLRFGERVAELAAIDFASAVFRRLLKTRLLVLGFDCRFGRDRVGDVAFCRRVGPELGFDVAEVAPVCVDGEPVHSTRIREMVGQGDIRTAARLLGRPYSLYGTVVSGDGRGGELGYPTANLDLHNEAVPPDGVYVGRASVDGDWQGAVVSIGTRPTFHHEPEPQRVVEVHLLDWSGDVYNRDMEVQILERLRGQRPFADAKALGRQIEADIRNARLKLARV